MTRGQIDTYKSRHHHKNMIEALQEMKKDRIPAYKTEYGLLPYSEARKKKYTSKQLEQLEYVPSALPRYPMLQSFDFTQDSMDILLRYEELFQKQSQCKREVEGTKVKERGKRRGEKNYRKCFFSGLEKPGKECVDIGMEDFCKGNKF